ncbi:EF-hand domain-containing protein [Dyella acidiphila]|uniref:EF-hand domain-containing protein n=1 Tax=Dyella acidiphila TaxID=2775866 RepID=A0ABR9G8D7_9GAMM|nr:EF-hand domain-containing protein [Dyella acidiphila]MBE1160281.1 EF-hand domain-containing protein [Dyella acidiphila]
MRAAVAAWLLWLPLAVCAQGTASSLFQAMDSNGDGRVSETEYVAYMSQGFYRLDRNHDGVLEADELPGGHGKPVTLQEWQDNLRREFRKLDHHHHGYLTERELLQPPQ